MQKKRGSSDNNADVVVVHNASYQYVHSLHSMVVISTEEALVWFPLHCSLAHSRFNLPSFG